jgi:hypothetical protein
VGTRDEEFGDLHGVAMDIVQQIADVTPRTPGGLAVSIRALRYAAPEFSGTAVIPRTG